MSCRPRGRQVDFSVLSATETKKLLVEHASIVRALVRVYLRPDHVLDEDDLISIANVGILEGYLTFEDALRKRPHANGAARLRGWIRRVITWRIREAYQQHDATLRSHQRVKNLRAWRKQRRREKDGAGVRKYNKLLREANAAHACLQQSTVISLDEVRGFNGHAHTLHDLVPDDTIDLEDAVDRRRRQAQVRQLVEQKLEGRELVIIAAELDEGEAGFVVPERTGAEVGRRLGITRQRVNQLRHFAIAKLKASEEAETLDNPV